MSYAGGGGQGYDDEGGQGEDARRSESFIVSTLLSNRSDEV